LRKVRLVGSFALNYLEGGEYYVKQENIKSIRTTSSSSRLESLLLWY